MVASVEEVSSSVVREYLSRKGLRRTIACMDEEHPRTEGSINNRSLLRQILNMEPLCRDNKAQSCPLKTLLEIIIKHHMEDKMSEKDPLPQRSLAAKPAAVDSEDTVKLRSDAASPPETDRLISKGPPAFWTDDQPETIRGDAEKKSSLTESTQKSRANRIRRGVTARPIASTPQESNKKRPHHKVDVSQPLLREEAENMRQVSARQKAEPWSSASRLDRDTSCETSGTCLSRLSVAEMVLDDLDDDADVQELSKVSFERSRAERRYSGQPMDQHSATELKVLLLGSALNCLSAEWRNQSLTFSENHDLRYGIVQRKGGPCGVLASVQAFVLKKLLFDPSGGSSTDVQLRLSNGTRTKCLVQAAAEILWRAGSEKRATVATCSGRSHFTPTGLYKSEGVFEKVTCFTVDNMQDLQLLLEDHVDQLEAGPLGCVLLAVSAVLSRSVEKVREDMDIPTSTLIGAHGYCTQELVSLLLCGRAVSNVFDDDVELDSGDGNVTLLKGVKGRCEVGLLSLFEHYNICKVGAYLKTPRFPIWVVCSESHFSVLFGLQRELLTNQDLEFNLYYYDGLANQQEEIRLTVSAGRSPTRPDAVDAVDADLTPPLELCIRTRWRDARVCWNDTEPIL